MTAWARVESFTPQHGIDLSAFIDVLFVVDTIRDLQNVSDGLRLLRQVQAQVRIALDEADYALVPLVETLKCLLVDIRCRGLDNFLLEKVIIKAVVAIFAHGWCAASVHRRRFGVLLLSNEARLFLIDLAILKCLLSKAFKDVLLLFGKLLLFLSFFSLGA